MFDINLTPIINWDYWKLIWAFLAGMVGSGAYITALYFRFIGDNDAERTLVLTPFLKKYSFLQEVSKIKCIWYCMIGGAVAVIFQVDVPNFVAVQSLILGATWPAVISQFLSGKMVAPSQKDMDILSKPPEQISPEVIEKAENLTEE